MKVPVPGVYAAPRKLADGSVTIYHYHRATGVRLPDDPANPSFLERVLLLNQILQQDPAGGRATARAMFPTGRKVQSGKVADPLQPNPAPPVPLLHSETADDAGSGGQGRTDQPVVAPKPKLPDGCFKHLFDRFKKSDEFTDLAQTTRDEYARHMRHLEPVLGLHQVSALTADLMDQLIGKFAKHPTLQKAIRRTMSVLLGYAMRILKWIPANPLLGVQKIRRRGSKEAGVRMPLSETRVARFRKVNPYGTRARATFELGLSTALRRGDLVKIPFEDVEAGLIHLRTGKPGIPIVVQPSEEAVLAVRAFRANHPEHADAFYALGAQKCGKPVHKRTISAEFEEAAKRAKFNQHERIHSLRYTAATRLFELNLHYEDIAEVTGHAMASMARHYCKRRKDAAEHAEMLKAAYGPKGKGRIAPSELRGTLAPEKDLPSLSEAALVAGCATQTSCFATDDRYSSSARLDPHEAAELKGGVDDPRCGPAPPHRVDEPEGGLSLQARPAPPPKRSRRAPAYLRKGAP